VVSHDREFLDNVVSSTLVFEGDGEVNEYVGGYDDWLRQRATAQKTGVVQNRKEQAPTINGKQKKPKKLSYKDQHDLESLPKQIEKLEAEIELLHEQMASPDFFQQEKETITQTQAQLNAVEENLKLSYQRWETLESKC